MKRFMALPLAAALALSAAVPAAAEIADGNNGTDIMHYDWNGNANGDWQFEDELFAMATVPFIFTHGQILEISVDGQAGQMRISNGEEIIFNFDESTAFVDGNDGTPMAPANLAEADEVIVYYGPALGRSYPPVGFASVVIGNTEELTIPPVFARVEAVEQGEDGLVVTLQNGGLLVTIPSDLVITPLFTRNIIVHEQISAGSELLLWYPFMTLAFPGTAIADRAVFVRQAEEVAQEPGEIDEPAEVIQDPQYEDSLYEMPPIFVDPPVTEAEPPTAPAPQPEVMTLSRALSFSADQFVEQDGVTMVPLRFVAEQMGFNVGWDDAQRAVTLSHADNQTFTTIFIGQDSFEGGMLEAAPAIINDRTFVPVSLFDILTA